MPRAYRTNRGYRMLVEPLQPPDVDLYGRVRAIRKALGLQYGSGAIMRAGLAAQVKALERAAARAGVDWRKELPPRDEAAHVAELAKRKRPRRVQVEAPPGMD